MHTYYTNISSSSSVDTAQFDNLQRSTFQNPLQGAVWQKKVCHSHIMYHPLVN